MNLKTFRSTIGILAPVFLIGCTSGFQSSQGGVNNLSTGTSPAPSSAPAPTPIPSPSPSPSPAPTNNAKLIFSDEFDSLSFFNSVTGQGTWESTCIGGVGSVGQQGGMGWGAEFDVSPTNTLGLSPYTISNGVLTMVTDRTPPNLKSQLGNASYISGAFRSVRGDFGYGYYEMRAQLPKGSGNWPAFWLLPGDGAWPPEIDIFEVLGVEPTKLFTTVHSTLKMPVFNQNPAPNHYAESGETDVGFDMTADFHVYGLEYTATTLTWYFDNVAKFTVATPSDLVNRPVYIIIDNAIGGWDNNNVDSSTVFPASYKMDYVRVYDSRPF